MSAPFRVRRRVEFADTDMAGIVHFSGFFRFMEAAEHAYLRGCGLSVFGTWQSQKITFPRVSATCDFSRPVRFEDELDIEVTVERVGRSSVTYRFIMRVGDEPVARGALTTVLCRVPEAGHALEAWPFPDALRQQLLAGPKEATS